MHLESEVTDEDREQFDLYSTKIALMFKEGKISFARGLSILQIMVIKGLIVNSENPRAALLALSRGILDVSKEYKNE